MRLSFAFYQILILSVLSYIYIVLLLSSIVVLTIFEGKHQLEIEDDGSNDCLSNSNNSISFDEGKSNYDKNSKRIKDDCLGNFNDDCCDDHYQSKEDFKCPSSSQSYLSWFFFLLLLVLSKRILKGLPYQKQCELAIYIQIFMEGGKLEAVRYARLVS